MTALKFEGARVTQEYGGDTWLSLRVEDGDQARKLCDKINSTGKVYMAEVKEHREKRSLDANRYMWALLGKMAAALGREKEDLYLDYIRRYGQYRDFVLEPESAGTFCYAWEHLGTGWPTEQVDYSRDGSMVVIRAYYGSSQYSTKRMSLLIDAVVEDCKELGIETATPDELARMMALYDQEREASS